MTTPPTEQERRQAHELARTVASGDGRASVDLDDVLRAFEVQRLTVARRRRLAEALTSAGLTITPRMDDAQRGQPVTLTLHGHPALSRTPEADAVSAPPPPAAARSRGGRWWTRKLWKVAVGVVLFVVGGKLAVLQLHPVQERTQGRRAVAVVKAFQDERQAGRYEAAARYLAKSELQRSGGRQRYIEAMADSPLSYADVNLAFKSLAVKEGSLALGDAKVAAEPAILRYARYGCKNVEGNYRLGRRGGWWLVGGEWKVEKTPLSQSEVTRCEPDEIIAAWRDARSDDPGVPAVEPSLPTWAHGRLQRVDPVAVRASSTDTRTASADWKPDFIVDQEKAGKPTAWRSARDRTLGAVVAFDLPRRLRLARISFHNGYTGSKARDYPAGRVARVVLTLSSQGRPPSSTVVALHPTKAKSDLTTLDCDFGEATRVSLRVDETSPPDARYVALADVRFWGVAPPSGLPAPPQQQQVADIDGRPRTEWRGSCG